MPLLNPAHALYCTQIAIRAACCCSPPARKLERYVVRVRQSGLVPGTAAGVIVRFEQSAGRSTYRHP